MPRRQAEAEEEEKKAAQAERRRGGACCPSSLAAYTKAVLTRLSVKAAPITNRISEYGPAVPACCNICRTCTTTNLVGLAIGGMTAAGVGIVSFARRFSAKPS
jgi:hypothetical protein